MDQQHKHGVRFSLRQRAGWLRIWLIVSICWASFAAYEIVENYWRLPSDLVISRAVYGEKAAAFEIEKGKMEARSICIDQSIKASSEPDPIPEAGSLTETDLEALAVHFGVSTDAIKANAKFFSAERSGGEIDLFFAQEALARQVERDRRNKARDFHTHIIRISCVLEKTHLKFLGLAAAIVLVSPFAVPLLGIGLFFLVMRLGRWLLAGFLVTPPESSAAPATVDQQTELAPLGELGPKQHAEPQIRERWRWHQWALVVLLMLVAGIVHGLVSKQTNGLAESAKQELVGRRNENRLGDFAKLEASLRMELPKAVGDNVIAVDVSMDDANLTWIYQRQGPSQMSDAAYLDNIASKACASGAIREIAEYGLVVKYELIDQSGKALGSRTINRC